MKDKSTIRIDADIHAKLLGLKTTYRRDPARQIERGQQGQIPFGSIILALHTIALNAHGGDEEALGKAIIAEDEKFLSS